MCIRELLDQFEIQGAYHIKVWKDDVEEYATLADGIDFEYKYDEINEDILERRITYMYAVDGVLVIEVEDR